jgi:probable rRNA maturation factor
MRRAGDGCAQLDIQRVDKTGHQVGIDVQVATERGDAVRARGIARWAAVVIERMGDDEDIIEVCIRVVDEAESAGLNADYRGQDKSTNVLSFPADVNLPGSGCRYLGDVVICDTVVHREAEQQHKRADDHLAHMVVHGMLHLYGYDHVEPTDADVMEDMEREILGQIGIADPYADG